jgi:hypothetical protein
VKEYDWVKPFEAETGCTVQSKIGNTSDEMVTLLRQGGGSVYDGVSASGDASNRLIANGDVAAVDPAQIPGFADISPFLQNAPHYVANGVHYGVPHGWGGNSMFYRTDLVTPPPTSWSAVFDPTASKPYQGKITDSFKGYTIGDNTHKELSKHPWRLDDEKLAYPAYERVTLDGCWSSACEGGQSGHEAPPHQPVQYCRHLGLVSGRFRCSRLAGWRGMGHLELQPARLRRHHRRKPRRHGRLLRCPARGHRQL